MRVNFMYAATFLVLLIGVTWMVKASRNPYFKKWIPITFMIAGILIVVAVAPLVPH
jgi:heme A synthase